MMPIHLSFPSYILFDQHLTQINPKPLLFSKNSVIYQKKPKNKKNALLAVLTCVSQAKKTLVQKPLLTKSVTLHHQRKQPLDGYWAALRKERAMLMQQNLMFDAVIAIESLLRNAF